MLHGVFPLPNVHGVRVRQERDPTVLLHQVADHLCIVGPEECKVPQFPEVHLDGDELLLHVDVADAGGACDPFGLGEEAVAVLASHIGEVHLGSRGIHDGSELLGVLMRCEPTQHR